MYLMLSATRRRKITSQYLKSDQLFKKRRKVFSKLSLSLSLLANIDPHLVISFTNLRMSMSLSRWDFLVRYCSIHCLMGLWSYWCILLSRLLFHSMHPVNKSLSSPSFRMTRHRIFVSTFESLRSTTGQVILFK